MKRGIGGSNDVDLVFRFRTRNTFPVEWLINSDIACLTCCCCCCCCCCCGYGCGCGCCLARRLAWRDRFRLSTRSKIPFGWLMKVGRRAIVALFVILFTGGALSALLLEEMVVEALLELPPKLLSLLFSEFNFVLSLLLFL